VTRQGRQCHILFCIDTDAFKECSLFRLRPRANEVGVNTAETSKRDLLRYFERKKVYYCVFY